MRFSTLALTLTLALYTAGCSKLVSLNPFVTGTDAKLDTALIGIWHDSEGDDTYIIKQDGSAYAITYLDKSPSSMIRFEARLFEVGDAKFLDLTSKNDHPFHITAHTPIRVWSDGATLRFAFLDSGWMRQQAIQQLPSQTTEGRTVITASGDAVRDFLTKYGTDPKAYGEAEVLRKAQ